MDGNIEVSYMRMTLVIKKDIVGFQIPWEKISLATGCLMLIDVPMNDAPTM